MAKDRIFSFFVDNENLSLKNASPRLSSNVLNFFDPCDKGWEIAKVQILLLLSSPFPMHALSEAGTIASRCLSLTHAWLTAQSVVLQIIYAEKKILSEIALDEKIGPDC